jgi:hypothetical protein
MLLEQWVYRLSTACSKVKYKVDQTVLEMAPRLKMLLAKIAKSLPAALRINEREER